MRLIILFFLSITIGQAQIQELNLTGGSYAPESFDASWITHPSLGGGEHAVVYFRKEFKVAEKQYSFIINLSADTHYRLFVNGQWLVEGPQLSDILHWKYETLDIAPYLKTGKNVIAIEVYNWGYLRHFGMQSIHTALLVNGFTDNAKVLNTKGVGDGWKCFWNKDIRGNEVKWRSPPRDIIGGLYANNPTDSVIFQQSPIGWMEQGFEIKTWPDTKFLEGGASAGGSFAWLLEPRNLPLQVRTERRFESVVKASGVEVKQSFLKDNLSLKIPANTKASFLIDNKLIDIGYPELSLRGGKGATVKLTYAENLFLPNGEKGHRDSLDSQGIVGYKDVLKPDGKARKYITTWLRSFRFIEVAIETVDEPLELLDFKYHASRAPIPVEATFESDNEMYNRIFEICKLTTELCVQDYFLSDAYYETMQYLGDTKVHAPVWQALSGNEAHTRNALMQFHQSRKPDGNLLGAYPLKTTFIFPTYSVIYVDMLWDYYKYRGDKEYLSQFSGGIQHTLDGFGKYIKSNGLVKKPPYSYFVDWYIDADKKNFGTAPGGNGGDNSGVVTLHYVHALQSAAKIFETLGDDYQAKQYLDEANRLKAAVVKLCYDDNEGIFATRARKDYFDMHTNIMAVLTDAVPTSKQSYLLKRILTDDKVSPASYYYRYYLFEAIQKTGDTQLFDLAQKPWEGMVNTGMTTTLERLESASKPTRSEVHPWSASPLLFYYKFLAGIQQKGIGWDEVVIEPKMGILKHIKGKYPTPNGIIEFDFSKTESGGLIGKVILPKGLTGEFKYGEKSIKLASGANKL